MFVTYPQSGNGQRQVMSDHCRNMFLSFHLVVVSRDPRGEVSLSFSSHRLAKQNVASFRWLLSFFTALGRAVNKAAVVVAGDGSSAGVAVLVVGGWLRSMMLVAIVLPQCGNCFKLLVAQHVVGVLQMVSSAGYCVLKRTIGVARCRVQRIGVDVQQSLESNGHCCSGRCLLCSVVMLVVMVVLLDW